MPVERTDWDGLVAGSRSANADLTLTAVLGESEGGGSGSFPGRLSDGERWYVKPQNNAQGQHVNVSEYLVSAIGLHIDAPVCEVRPVAIPADLAGHQFVSGLALVEGVATASKAVPGVFEDRQLLHRERDDNRRRHAGVFVLYDWCWGGDPQWLYSTTEESKLFSHDHGWYFPPEGPSIDEPAVVAVVGEAHVLGFPDNGLDTDELARLADALEGVTRRELQAILAGVPSSWPIPDTCLEAVGYFLEARAGAVSGRARAQRAKLLGTT